MVVPSSNPNQLIPHSIKELPSTPMISPSRVVSEDADSVCEACGGAGGGSAAVCIVQGCLLTATTSGSPVPLDTCRVRHCTCFVLRLECSQLLVRVRADFA